MCRHFAYLGDQVTIRSVLFDPPHSLVEQAWAPRWQRHGTMNVDGFGVGWYSDDDGGPVPPDRPIGRDARPISRGSPALRHACAVPRPRSARQEPAAPYAGLAVTLVMVGTADTPGARRRRRPGSSARQRSSPRRPGGAAESINGRSRVPRAWPRPRRGARLAERLPAANLLQLHARCDTALLWAIVLPRLRAGEPAGRRAGRYRHRHLAGRRHAAGSTCCSPTGK